MKPWQLFFWLTVAATSQLTLALYGMLARFLMTKASPPVPALRLCLLANLLAEACLLACYSLPASALVRPRAGYRLKPSGTQSDLQSCAAGQGSLAGSLGGKEDSEAEQDGMAHQQPETSQGAVAAAGQLAELALLPPAGAEAAGAAGAAGAGAAQEGSASEAAEEVAQETALAGLVEPYIGEQYLAIPIHASTRASTPAKRATQTLQLSATEASGALLPVAAPPSSPVHRRSHHPSQPATLAAGAAGAAAAAGPTFHTPHSPHQLFTSPPPHAPPAPQRSSVHSVRPDLPMRHGLSRRFDALYLQRPARLKAVAVATLTLSFLGVYGFQAVAPGFVDPAIPQLVLQFSVLCVALTQSLLLRRRPPWYTWPCAGAMVGGAAMIIVPGLHMSTSGSLNTARGWAGFGFSLGSLVSSVVYLVVIQATRHLGLKAEELLHVFFISGAALFAALSLPIDGTNWGAQLGPWNVGDWAILLTMSSICYAGSATAIQHCTWRLGAPTTAMFFGLRLVFTCALSTPILGSTIVQMGVQVAGVAVTTSAVTAYFGAQLLQGRRGSQAAACQTG